MCQRIVSGRSRRGEYVLWYLETRGHVPVGTAVRRRREPKILSEFSLLDGVESQRGTEARGLGAAFVLGGTAVSLPSEEQWRAMRIPLHHIWYDQGGSEQENCVAVLNLSERHQAEGVSDSLLEASQAGLKSSPIALAERKAECFPHLSFGRDVSDRIVKLPPALLPGVVAKLAELDDASRAWRRNTQMNRPVLPNCRPESEPTMQQFGDRRVFRDTKGEKRTYELHKNVGLEYRIHLRVVHESTDGVTRVPRYLVDPLLISAAIL